MAQSVLPEVLIESYEQRRGWAMLSFMLLVFAFDLRTVTRDDENL